MNTYVKTWYCTPYDSFITSFISVWKTHRPIFSQKETFEYNYSLKNYFIKKVLNYKITLLIIEMFLEKRVIRRMKIGRYQTNTQRTRTVPSIQQKGSVKTFTHKIGVFISPKNDLKLLLSHSLGSSRDRLSASVFMSSLLSGQRSVNGNVRLYKYTRESVGRVSLLLKGNRRRGSTRGQSEE